MLEVICLNATDAIATEKGGAHRIELVGTMDSDGLSPTPGLVREVCNAVDIPVRVMLRHCEGFEIRNRSEIAELATLAQDFYDAGANGVVLGFLKNGTIDKARIDNLLSSINMAAPNYTFHRAIDHAQDYVQAWNALESLSYTPDTVLTAGSAAGVTAGLNNLLSLAKTNHWAADRILIGGGLSLGLVPPLKDAGYRNFHIGSKVRAGGSFDEPVSAELVREWVEAIG
ncbi:copper homeostasis protein [Arcanobacterium pluranimalium]|uniref:copper homeostasis protein CutC n=1 Tax=Arcanobacterium pluranimalium TaxID=108028 RepID=UPI00195947DB|nr:copper homeostasis protein CutC [Arcanobacterium pluranimalium]MBM7825026.1 copper homeostasis protein [Arcanobacterium pluranimalium]